MDVAETVSDHVDGDVDMIRVAFVSSARRRSPTIQFTTVVLCKLTVRFEKKTGN